MKTTRYILPVVAGAMAGIVLISIGEMGLHHIYPLPPGVDLKNKAALAAALSSMPASAYAALLVAHMVCALLAGVIATLVIGRISKLPAIVVGIALTLAALFNDMLMAGQPMWFSVADLLVYIPFAWMGYILSRRKVAMPA